MSENLVTTLAPKLKALSDGGYAKGYRHGRKLLRTGLHQLIEELLGSLKIPFEEDVRVPGSGSTVADFLVNGTFVFVGRPPAKAEMRRLARAGKDCVIITREPLRSGSADHGVRVVGLGESGELQTIFLDDPSFNFDYAHILPKTEKCSVMHGHTSAVLVEIVGRPIDGMVVDFGAAKDIVRSAVRSLDHKLFINERYVTKSESRRVVLSFRTVHGDFEIKAPTQTTVLLRGEATVENLAREVLSRISPKMPDNVTAVGVYVYEGLNKGSHLLAQIHGDGDGPREKR